MVAAVDPQFILYITSPFQNFLLFLHKYHFRKQRALIINSIFYMNNPLRIDWHHVMTDQMQTLFEKTSKYVRLKYTLGLRTLKYLQEVGAWPSLPVFLELFKRYCS